jgi:hypothetical protein
MNRSKVALYAGLSLATLFVGCRSRQEAAGDKYRKVGDPLHALMNYEEALKRGKVSKEFYKNYTLVNIQAMDMRSKEDPTAEFLDVLKDTVASLLTQHPDAQNQELFANTLQKIANARIKMGTPEAVEGGFRFLEAAKKAGGGGNADAAKGQIVASKMKEIDEAANEAAKDPNQGIIADYKLNKLALMVGGATPEMQSLWSKVRKANLSTYLMYDNDDVVSELGERPDARINKYGVLLGIVKYEPGPTTKIQVKAWNGASLPFEYRSEGFTLVTKDGQQIKPSAAIGGFYKGGKPKSNTKPDPGIVQKGDESKTGGLTFKLPAGAQPDYLEFKCDAGTTRKYLP